MRRRHVVLLAAIALCGAASQPAAGRDFPKTLIFDEPGIDDEVSLPTVSRLPRANETDLAFELDKRLTTWLSVQLNTGYTALPQPGGTAYGWQNTSVTLKALVLSDGARERLISLSISRELGGTGALRVGAARAGGSAAAVNFGQGAAPWTGSPWLKPFAVTGTLAYTVPDDRRAPRQALVGASLQYSLAALDGTPAPLLPLIPIVEYTSAQPSGMLAPGLIYAGEGYQLAVELLIPLTRQTGTHLGAVAQINLSLARLGLHALAVPLLQ